MNLIDMIFKMNKYERYLIESYDKKKVQLVRRIKQIL